MKDGNHSRHILKMRNIAMAVLILGSGFIAQQALAQTWILVDNLITHAPGSLGGQVANGPDGGSWTSVGMANSVVVTNSSTGVIAAVTGGTATGGAAPLGADWLQMPQTIGGGSTAATVFFQFDMGTTPSLDDLNWSLETVGNAKDSSGVSSSTTEVAVEFNSDPGARSGFTVRNGSKFTAMSPTAGPAGTLAFVPAADTMYSVWAVINQNAQTYNVYMAGGTLGTNPVEMYISNTAVNTTTTNSVAPTGTFSSFTGARIAALALHRISLYLARVALTTTVVRGFILFMKMRMRLILPPRLALFLLVLPLTARP